MTLQKLSLGFAFPLVLGLMMGCSHQRSPDVSASIRMALDGAGLKNVTVSDNRDRGVVTLGGQVASDDDKSIGRIARKISRSRPGCRRPDSSDSSQFGKRTQDRELRP